MVMPRSRSSSMSSRNCADISRAETAPVASRMRSASVDFPWSMWAMIEKLRMCVGSRIGRMYGSRDPFASATGRLTTARAGCHHRARDTTRRKCGGRDGAAGARCVDPTAARRLRGAPGDRRPVRDPGSAQRGLRLRRERAPLRDGGHRLAVRLEGGAGAPVDRPLFLRPARERGEGHARRRVLREHVPHGTQHSAVAPPVQEGAAMRKPRISFRHFSGSGPLSIYWHDGPYGDAVEAVKGRGVAWLAPNGELLGVEFDDVARAADAQTLELPNGDGHRARKEGQ